MLQMLLKRSINLQNSGLSSLFCVVLLSFILTLVGCAEQSKLQAVTLSGPTMGTEFRISAITHKDLDLESLKNEVEQVLQMVNQSMSTYLPESELSQINRLAADTPVELSNDLLRVMLEAQRISQLSQGAFDVTLGKVIDLWGFGPQGSISKQPSSEIVAQLKPSVGFRLLEVQGSKLLKRHSDVHISLSAIAKGFAVDQVAATLEQRGVQHYLINIGGELRAAGAKLDGSAWKVGIEKPHVLGGIAQVIELHNSAIATSGDYRNYHIIDGQHYSHTIDPKTLSPVYYSLALVSVKHASAMTADALATAIMAMGEEAGMIFAEENKLEAYLVIRTDQKDHYRIEMTDSFRSNLQ